MCQHFHGTCRSLRGNADAWVYKTFEAAIESGLNAMLVEPGPGQDCPNGDGQEAAVSSCPTPAEFRQRMLEPTRLLLKSLRQADPKTAGTGACIGGLVASFLPHHNQ